MKWLSYLGQPLIFFDRVFMGSTCEVSIIITIYNKLNYFEESIYSALNQKFDNFEVIVIDDCSTDGTRQSLKDLESSFSEGNISFHYMERNVGVVECRNYGINIAKGKYIIPLDGDDLMEPQYIRLAYQYMENNSDCGICYCQAELFGNKSGIWYLPAFDNETIWRQNCIFSCAMFRKVDALEVGGYDSAFNQGHEDWDFWLSLISLGRSVHRIDRVLFKYRIIDGSRTSKANIVLKNTIKKFLLNIWIGLNLCLNQ